MEVRVETLVSSILVTAHTHSKGYCRRGRERELMSLSSSPGRNIGSAPRGILRDLIDERGVLENERG